MAITITKRAELADTTNDTAYAVSAYTPGADTIQIAHVFMTASDGSTVGTMGDIEGAWTRKHIEFTNPVGRAHYIFWRKVDATPVSITPSFSGGADQGSGCGILILEYDPDTMPSGDPIRQVKYSTGTATTSLAFAFDSAVLTGNGYSILARTGTNPAACTEPTSWTEQFDSGFASPTTGVYGCSRAGGETGTSFTVTAGASTDYEGLAVEVWNEEPPAGSDTYSGRGIGRGISRGVMR